MIHLSYLCYEITTLKRRVQIVSNRLFLKEILNHEYPFRFGKATFTYPSHLQNNFCPYAVLILSLTEKYVV